MDAQELLARYRSGERIFVNQDLSGVNLEGKDLRGIQLMGSDLTNATLSGVDFRNACLDECCFENSALWQAIFTNARCVKTDFLNSDLRGADFSGTNLSASKMINCNLSGANFTNARLYLADLRGALMGSSIFMNTDLEQAVGNGIQVITHQMDYLTINIAPFYGFAFIGHRHLNLDNWLQLMNEGRIGEFYGEDGPEKSALFARHECWLKPLFEKYRKEYQQYASL